MPNTTHSTWQTTLAAGATLAMLGAAPALGQSLFLRESRVPLRSDGQPDLNSEMRSASLFFVEPPPPREFSKHDLITIIVDETSSTTSSQSLDTEKKVERDVNVGPILDPWQLLELRLREGGADSQTLLSLDAERKFEGEGDYSRDDKFNARITATVIEVKPNGTLVLQATKHIKKDDEEQHLVLSGIVRQDDVTNRNTVLSSQMADMNLVLKNDGEVRQAAKKGIITRVLDTLFAY